MRYVVLLLVASLVIWGVLLFVWRANSIEQPKLGAGITGGVSTEKVIINEAAIRQLADGVCLKTKCGSILLISIRNKIAQNEAVTWEELNTATKLASLYAQIKPIVVKNVKGRIPAESLLISQ